MGTYKHSVQEVTQAILECIDNLEGDVDELTFLNATDDVRLSYQHFTNKI